MTARRALALAVAVPATMAAIASPAMATPKAGEQTFPKTFPLASALCARVSAGTENRRLKAHAAAVTADCTVLQSTFSAAQVTVLSARTTIEPQITAARLTTATACPKPQHQPVACRMTRNAEDQVIKVLHRQLRTATRHYYEAIEKARALFWSEIRAFPGEHRIHADPPVIIQPS